jgi:hypothetical protein
MADDPRTPSNAEILATIAYNKRIGRVIPPYPRELTKAAEPTTLSRRVAYHAASTPAKHPDMVDVDPRTLRYSNNIGLRAAHHRLAREGK